MPFEQVAGLIGGYMGLKTEIYDAKLKCKVLVPLHATWKVKIHCKDGKTRYALKAYTDDGRTLTRSVSADYWSRYACQEKET